MFQRSNKVLPTRTDCNKFPKVIHVHPMYKVHINNKEKVEEKRPAQYKFVNQSSRGETRAEVQSVNKHYRLQTHAENASSSIANKLSNTVPLPPPPPPLQASPANMYEAVPDGSVVILLPSACNKFGAFDDSQDEDTHSFASFSSALGSLPPTPQRIARQRVCNNNNNNSIVTHHTLVPPADAQRAPAVITSRLPGARCSQCSPSGGGAPSLQHSDFLNLNAATHPCCSSSRPPCMDGNNDHHLKMTTDEQQCCAVGIGDRVDIEHIKLERQRTKTKNVGVQTTHLSPYRLRFWPAAASIKCLDASFMDVVKCCLRTLSQWFLSQVGLTCMLFIWALLGATAFYKAEGPREFEQAEQIMKHKNDIAIDLATDLRQLQEGSDAWPATIQKYLSKHESLLLKAVSSGYVEGGGSIWTYPGCVLFAVLLLTTLGFGAPVPRTPLGRGMAVLFSAIGIPLHFLLILNISNLIAKRLQNLATIKPVTETATETGRTKRHLWYKWFPPVVALFYYILGVICFGILRNRSVVECLMFALDFTESGGVANTAGYVRVLYALYIEIAVILAATIMSMIQVSATNGIIDLGLRLGLLTNT